MPITPNYGWTTPVVNGDFGAWGGILNAAFVEIDADVKALADVVAANAVNVARTNINNTFAGTQTFNAINASGNISASGGLYGAQVFAQTAANGSNTVMFRTDTGTDATLGSLYAQLSATPSAVGANRLVMLQIGDSLSVRKLAFRASQTYIGAADPSFVGTEMLHVNGAVQASSVNATTFFGAFSGSGAGLSGISQSAVTNLVSDLSTISLGQDSQNTAIAGLNSSLAGKSNVGHGHAQSDITGLAAALAGKSDVGHTHDFSQIPTGTVPWSRVANPPHVDFANGVPQAFTFAATHQAPAGGTSAPSINRPGAYTSYSWSWIRISAIGSNTESWIPVLSGVNI